MKVVLQDGIKDCGICSLLSIIRFYGGEVSKEYLREITNTTKDGVSLYNLIEGAKKIGFDAIGVTGTLEDIKVNNLPCIVHTIVNKSYKHYIVLYQINNIKQEVLIMDPAKGKKTISFSEYNMLTSKNYIFLKPTKQLPFLKKKNIIKKILKDSFHTNKNSIIVVSLLTILYFLFNIIYSLNFKFLIDYSINYNMTLNILLITYIVLLIAFFKNINFLLKNILLSKWNSIFDINTTTTTYKQILLLPYLYFKNRTTGEVISRFRDLNVIRDYLSNVFCTITTDLICIILFLILMFRYIKTVTSIILFLVLLLILYTFLIKKKKKKIIKNIKKNEEIINTYLIQGISNVDTIKGSHLEKRFIDKFLINYKAFIEIVYKYTRFNEINNFIKTSLNDLIYITIYSLGSYLVIKNKINLSSLIVFQNFTNYFLGSVYRIQNIVEEYSTYKVSKDRIEELFLIREENFSHNYYYLSYDLKGDIEFTNLNYKVGNKYLFNNLNLVIKENERILLSGESGTGKSTLVKILMRYINIDYGMVKIKGIDINHYHLENIRKNITYVTSNEYLFNDTIKNNISLYKEYHDEEINKVCEVCFVNEIINNKDTGLNTMIEENGFNLSNGERQRIILARSILKESSIYIFDEALGQIDISKEKKILESIFKYLNNKIIIVISHRFNNKKLFDKVLKLEEGIIIES